MKLLKRVTKTANSRGNESRIAKQDQKNFLQIVETANGKLANGEGCLYNDSLNLQSDWLTWIQLFQNQVRRYIM